MTDKINLFEILINIVTFLVYIILIYSFANMIYNIIKPFYFSTFGSKFDIGRSDYVGFDIYRDHRRQ